MKRNKLPSKKEWDNIINEAFSSYEDHRFSERYLQKKEKIEKTERGVIMKKSANRPERLFIGLTTAAVLAAVAIPTTAITLNHMNNPGSPATQLAAEADTESAASTTENTLAATEGNAPDTSEAKQSVSTEPMAIGCNNLPDGFYMDKIELPAQEDQNVTTQEYDRQTLHILNGNSGAIHADLYTIPENYEFTTNDYAPNIENPDKTETFRIDNKTVFLTRSLDFGKNNVADSAYIRDVWVKFDGSNHAVKLMATHGVSDEEIKEFIKGLSLVPAKEAAPEWSYTPDIKEVPPTTDIENATETPEITEDPKTYVFGWMPDDMPFNGDENHPFIKIRRSSDNAGITPQLFNNIGDRELVPQAICEFPTKDEYDLEGKHVTIFYASNFRKVEPGAFGRNVWITFEGSQYGAFFFVSDNVEDDILAKIIENIYLVPVEKNQALDYEKTYKEIMERNKKFSATDSNK